MIADYDAAVRDHVVDMLILGRKLVALIEMRTQPDHLLIVNVAVSTSYQGRGHGRNLLVHAENFARLLGLEKVRLYTNGSFTEDLELYRGVGYEVARQETSPTLGIAIYMSKRLFAASPSAQQMRSSYGLLHSPLVNMAVVLALQRSVLDANVLAV